MAAAPIDPVSAREVIHAGEHAQYVALGSSFAAGPGIGSPADRPFNRCARSNDDYAHQLARKAGFDLVDVSRSGARGTHVLQPWGDLLPQIDAVKSDTAVVTITVGGNDVGYIGGLMSASCRFLAAHAMTGASMSCFDVKAPVEDNWSALRSNMVRIIVEIRRRAPTARIFLVDYLTVLPARGSCAAVPLDEADAAASRAVAERLAALTHVVAAQTHSELIRASAISRGHDACSADPYVCGYPRPEERPFIAYHPNVKGMTAIADALYKRLNVQH